jgi:hypothetical protein
MADNTVLNLGSGGDTIATDDIGDVKYPLNKIVWGDTPTDVSMTTGFPVALSDTDNAVLDSIAASNTSILTAVQLLDNAIVGSAMQVDVVSALVAGTANIGIVSLSDTDNDVLDSIASTNTDIKTAVEAVITGSEMQVDVVTLPSLPAGTENIGDVDVVSLPSLPAGTENIGDVDIVSLPSLPAGDENIGNVDVVSLPSLPAGDENIGNVDIASALPIGNNNIGNVDIVTLPSLVAGSANIGDVDVLSVIPGTGATDLGKADDAAHAENDVGVMPLAVRTDSGISLVDTDGDYSPLQVDNTGRLRVNSGGSGGSATEYDEDVQHTAGDAGTMPLAVRNDDVGTLVDTDGDYAPLQVDSTGKLWVTSSGSGGSATEYNEDAVTPGTIVGTTSMMERDDVLTTGVAEADWAAFKCNVNGALWVGVDGTVALSDTDNAVLDSIATSNTAIQTAVQVLDNAIVGSAMQVDVVTLPSLVAGDANIGNVDVLSVVPGTGATDLGKAEDAPHAGGDVGVMGLTVKKATAAATSTTDGDYQPLITDSTGRLHVKDKNSDAIRDAVQAVEGAITGSEMQVDVVTLPSLPAGTENIGDVDVVSLPSLPAGTENIGDVDVLSVIPGTGATNLGKAEDSIHAEGDVGVMPLAVRNDTAAALGADGDYTPLQVDSSGKLWVTSSGSGGSATEYNEDDATPATIVGTTSMMERDDIKATLTPADGDWAAFRCSKQGALWVALADSDQDIGSVIISEIDPGFGQANLGKAESLAHTNGAVGVFALAIRNDADAISNVLVSDGDYAPLQVDEDGRLKVEVFDGGDVGTVALSDTDNAVLDSIASTNTDIKTAVEALDNAISGSQMQVDVVAELPAGTKTIGSIKLTDGTETASVNSSNQLEVAVAAALPIGNNNIGNVDIVTLPALVAGSANIGTVGLVAGTEDIGTVALSDTDNAVLDSIDTSNAAIKTAVEAVITGNEMQVDVVSLPALAAGTAAIGTVEVTSIVPGTGATNLGKEVDAAHTGEDVGVMPLAVRRDADTTLCDANGDYAPLQVDADGKLKVEVFDGGDSLTVDNGGTFAVQVSAALPIGNNNIGNVDIVTLPSLVAGSENIGTVGLVAGSANIGTVGLAAGSENIGTVALSDTDNAVLDSIDTSNAAIKTAVEILDGAISSDKMQVDIVTLPPLVAGSANIGDVDVLTLPPLVAGSANIGDVDVLTLPSLVAGSANIGDVDVLTLPPLVAGSANIGNVDIESAAATSSNMGAALMTNVIHDGVTALTPKFAKIDVTSSGNNTLVAASVGKKIRVLSMFMVSAGTVTARLESNDADDDGTELTGQMNLVANSGFTLPFNPVGWFETGAGQFLNLELSGVVSVDGCLVYVEV